MRVILLLVGACKSCRRWLQLSWHVLAAVALVSWLVACNWGFSPKVVAGISVLLGVWIMGEAGKSRRRLRGNSFWLAFLYRSTSGYFAPMRILVLALFAVVGFAFLYLSLDGIQGFTGVDMPTSAHGFSRIVTWTKEFTRVYVYFSAVTFSSLGYGDLRPTPQCRLVAIGEVLLGLILLTTYITLAVHKMTLLYRYAEPEAFSGTKGSGEEGQVPH